jgi:hypothetical protein
METEGSLPHSQEPAPVPILSQLNTVHASLFHFLKIDFNIIYPPISTPEPPSGIFPLVLPMKTLYALLRSPIRATCLAHLILLCLITRIILEHGARSSLL